MASMERVASRRTKEGKELWHQFAIQTEGLTILSKDQDKQIEAMARAIYDHPAAAYLLAKPGKSEIMVNWQDRTLVDCRGIIDRLTDDGLIIDIKTTDDASPKGFARSCHKYRYHVQAEYCARNIGAVAVAPVDVMVTPAPCAKLVRPAPID